MPPKHASHIDPAFQFARPEEHSSLTARGLCGRQGRKMGAVEMPHDIDWTAASDDFHPDFALAARALRQQIAQGAHHMSALAFVQKWAPHAIALFNSAIFLDSLRYKFTDHVKTQEIFTNRLDGWAASFGAKGLFAHTGIFSQYVIGTGELLASGLLLFGMFVPAYRFLQPLGALIGLAIMTGAISFHLFTPLGTDPNHDGGGLFIAACTVWVGCVAMLILRGRELAQLGHRAAAFLAPAA